MSQPQPSPSTHSRAALLRRTAAAFCNAFLEQRPPAEILSTFFSSSSTPTIHEHGPPWASAHLPFLARTFRGRAASHDSPGAGTSCDDYFALLAAVLAFEPAGDSFPPPDQFVVDAAANAVSVVAHGRFRAVKTGRAWEERFVYRLSGFDAEGKIGMWEIWADPLSAWDAVGDGRLSEV